MGKPPWGMQLECSWNDAESVFECKGSPNPEQGCFITLKERGRGREGRRRKAVDY